jgi:hypothetical protein
MTENYLGVMDALTAIDPDVSALALPAYLAACLLSGG